MPCHSCLVGGRILFLMLCFNYFKTVWISHIGICGLFIINYIFDRGFRFNFQTELYQNFGKFSGVRKFRNYVFRLGFRVFVFQTDYDIMMPCEFLAGFWKTGPLLRTRDDCHVSTFRSGHDNFICIRVVFS